MMDRFVSVHVPKTGGTIFQRRVLNELFPRKVKKKYGEPLLGGDGRRSRDAHAPDIIHGHFQPIKYADFERPFVTWLSCPLDRMISHYSYSLKHNSWRVGGGKARTPSGEKKPFWYYLFEYKNFMTKIFEGFDMGKFIFVGILEYWKESLERFGELTGKDVSEYLDLDEYPRKASYYYVPTPWEIEMFEELNQEDILLWKKYAKPYQEKRASEYRSNTSGDKYRVDDLPSPNDSEQLFFAI